jgi:gliding motility-associated-like protein
MPLSYVRKYGLSFLLVLSVLYTHAQCAAPINTFPYVEDFETSAAWTTAGAACTPLNLVINDWAWGHPQKNVINTAGSGNRCWIVGDTTGWLYAYGERSWVESPCFNFTAVQRPYIQFKIFWESENKYDGTVLQYSINAGSNWTNVGSAGDPTDCMDTNWYNYTNISNLGSYSHSLPGHGGTSQTYPALTTVKEGWCGNIQASNYTDTTGVSGSTCQAGRGRGHWVTAKHCMPYLAGTPQVLFRVAFGAGTSCNNFNGFAFDSVAIGEGSPNTSDFTHSCVNTSTIHFSGITSLCPDTFQWNFGDPGSGASNTVLGAGNLNPNHTFSAPGTYNVTFTVTGGPCNAPGSVTKPVTVIGATTTTTPAGCSGTGGTAIAIVAGNAQPYTYSWSTIPVQTHDTATGLASGTYTVTVTTVSACSATATATVSAASALSHSVATTPSLCTANNGTAKVTESGGNPVYTYIWSNGLGTADSIKNAAPGSYVLSITDSHGCTDTAHVTIANTGNIAATIASTINPVCHGQNTGSITITATGGTQPYSYHWGATMTSTNTQTGLTAGNYIITVTDNNGCQTTVPDNITQPTALVPAVTTVTTLCGASTGQAKVMESGGTPGYTYLWSAGLGIADSIINVPARSYTLTVTDNAGCKDTVPVNISNSGGVTATLGATTNVSCPGGNNGTITVSAANGTTPYTYHWGIATNGNATQTGFIAGSYVITVTDNAGCVTTVAATISAPQPFSHTSTTRATTCNLNNGFAQVIESGGTQPYTYAWSGGANITDSLVNSAPGAYTLTITDANACQDVVNVTIGTTPLPQASATATQVSCNGGTDAIITVTASSGVPPYTYNYGNNIITTSNTQSGFAAGSYNIIVTDSNHCPVSTPVTVLQPSPLTAIPTATNATCHGGSDGSVSLVVSGGNGGNTFTWTNTTQATQNITNLSANTYSVIVTDQKGCTKDTFAIVTEPSAIVITFPTVINDSCSYSTQGSATADATGSNPGYTYVWSDVAATTGPTLSGLAPGSYTVTATDINHCTASAAITISAPSPLILTPAASPVTCHGDSDGTASISASGGTPGYTYLWSVDSTTAAISQLHPGSYAVTVTDSWGCTASQSAITVINPDAISVSVAVSPQSCASQQDGSVSLTASGGTPQYSYTWSPATAGTGPAISGLTAGSYLYTVTDSRGCLVSDSAIVTLSAAITLQAVVAPPLCPPINDGSITISPSGGNPGYTYTWSNADQSATASQLGPGTYLLTVTDSRGCAEMDTFRLRYQSNLTVNAGITDTIDLGQSVTLTAVTNRTTGDISYIWSPDYHLSCATCQSTTAGPLQTFTYYVTANDTNGCRATDSLTVIVKKDYNLYVPNAFTPNGDDRNDYFQIYGDMTAWKYVEVQIFNRWGEKVFESHDMDFKWDGTYRGKLQEPNVYVYVLNVSFVDGHSTGVLKGSVTLIR